MSALFRLAPNGLVSHALAGDRTLAAVRDAAGHANVSMTACSWQLQGFEVSTAIDGLHAMLQLSKNDRPNMLPGRVQSRITADAKLALPLPAAALPNGSLRPSGRLPVQAPQRKKAASL
jgi:hypothetical protein